jgi:hypothetical protein
MFTTISRINRGILGTSVQGSIGTRKFFVCLAPAVLIFFIVGLLDLMRFERVDNLGAHRIPPETGLLIPSGFDSYSLSLGGSAPDGVAADPNILRLK